MDIHTKDGIILQGVPDDTPKEVIQARIDKIRAEGASTTTAVKSDSPGMDLLKGAGSGVVKGAQNLASMFTSMMDAYGSSARPQVEAEQRMTNPEALKIAQAKGNTGSPLFTPIVDKAAAAAGANYEPFTAGGRYSKSVGEQVAPYLAGPGTIPMKVAGAVSSGMGAEAGNQLMGGDSNVGKFVGGLAGGLVPAGVAMKVKNSNELLADAVKGLSGDDFNKARQIKQTLQDLNLPHLNSQVFDTPTSLPSLAQRISESPESGSRFLRYLQGVPEQTRAALEGRMGTMMPSGGGQAARDATQAAAEQRIANLRTQASKEFVAASPARFTYDKMKIKQLYDDLNEEAINMGTTTTAAQIIRRKADKLKDENGNWETDSNAIAQLYKELNDTFPELGKLSSVPAKRVQEIFKAATPEFDPAREAFSSFHRDVIDPAKKSLTGQVATYGGGQEVDQITKNANMHKLIFTDKEPQVQAIRKLSSDLASTGDKEAFAGVTADYVSQAMEKAFAPAKGSKFNVNAPSNLTHAIYSTNAQKVNLNTAIEEVAKTRGLKPSLVGKGFTRLFEALDSYKDLKITGGVSGAEVQETASKSLAGGAVSPFFVARRRLESITQGKTYKQIADILMSPKGLDTLEKLSTYSPHSQAANSLIEDLFAASAGTQTLANAPPN